MFRRPGLRPAPKAGSAKETRGKMAMHRRPHGSRPAAPRWSPQDPHIHSLRRAANLQTAHADPSSGANIAGIRLDSEVYPR
jgi:hypothetical protein